MTTLPRLFVSHGGPMLPLLTAAGAGGEAGRTMHRGFEWVVWG
jgi:hypothetical protein